MSAPAYRAIRFLIPDVDAHEEFAGLVLNPRGGIDMVDGAASVRQAILLLLKTMPGERVMRPRYGCELYRLLFAPNDATTAGLAMHYVRQALELWEPRIDILRLDASASDLDPWRLDVALEYRVKATRQVESLVVPVDLGGQEA